MRCDAWTGLPVRDGSAAAVLSVFAPRNPSEAARVLSDGGVFVVVTPERGHLGELVGRVAESPTAESSALAGARR